MKRISINLVLTAITFLTVCANEKCSDAQIRASRAPSSIVQKKQIATLSIKHASMDHAQEVLEAVLAGDDSHLVADEEARRFILIGSPESMNLAMEAIDKIDQQREPKSIAPTALFRLSNVSAKQALETIDGLFNDSSLRMSIDNRTNTIIASASEKRLDEIRNLVELLDVDSTSKEAKEESPESQDCELRISWLVDSSSFPEGDQKLLRKVRPSLRKLADKLKSDSGLEEIATLTDVQVLTSNGQFENTSLRRLDSSEVEIIASGNAQRTKEGNFDLQLELRFTASDQAVNLRSRFSAPADHPVAFSISDIGSIRSYLVVEVSAADKE